MEATDKAIIPTRVYSIKEAAELLNMHPQIVTRYCKEGKIKARKVGQWKILGESLLDFVRNG